MECALLSQSRLFSSSLPVKLTQATSSLWTLGWARMRTTLSPHGGHPTVSMRTQTVVGFCDTHPRRHITFRARHTPTRSQHTTWTAPPAHRTIATQRRGTRSAAAARRRSSLTLRRLSCDGHLMAMTVWRRKRKLPFPPPHSHRHQMSIARQPAKGQ